MTNLKRENGISLITLIVTIIVIIILATIGVVGSTGTLDEAVKVKFEQEYSEVKKGVQNIILINSKEGIDEETLNKGFKKVIVVDPPEDFESFDSGESTEYGYLVDLKLIDYDKVNLGQKYKDISEGSSVKFNEDDVFVYDKNHNVYYVKGMYDEEEGKIIYKMEK